MTHLKRQNYFVEIGMEVAAYHHAGTVRVPACGYGKRRVPACGYGKRTRTRRGSVRAQLCTVVSHVNAHATE